MDKCVCVYNPVKIMCMCNKGVYVCVYVYVAIFVYLV